MKSKKKTYYWKFFIIILFCITVMKANIVHDINNDPANSGLLLYQKIFSHKTEPKDDNRDASSLIIDKVFEKIIDDGTRQYFTLQKITDFLFVLLRISIILALSIFLWRLSNRTTKKIIQKIVDKHQKSKKKYENYNGQLIIETASPIVLSSLHWILAAVSILLIFEVLGIDIMPIIYSFGVIGLAISIGSQALVKDLINGILTLFEGNIAIGETIKINDNIGVIEGISLRCIELRHGSGSTQTIPFSEINMLQNLSRDYAMAKIQIAVAHEADILVVEGALRSVYQQMKESLEFGKMIKGDIQLKGISHFTETAVYVVAVIKTQPDPFQDFTREFNRLLHIKLQELKVPFPLITPLINQ